MKKINSLIAVFLIGNMLFGDVLELASPNLTASSAYHQDQKSPVIAINNPALTGDIQRYTFDFNYLFLTGLNSSKNGLGHSISLGGAMPSKYGVLSSNIDLLLTDGLSDSTLNIGNGAAIDLNFSKQIYSDLYFGAGITSILGSGADGFDWGLGLNVGFVKKDGNLAKYLNDFRWGASFRNIGKGYDHSSLFDAEAPSPSFTPELFSSFTLYNNNNIKSDLASAISFPSFSDVNFGVGSKNVFFNKYIFDTSVNANLREIADGDFDSLIPSIYLGYNLNIGDDEAEVAVSANPYAKGIWAFGVTGTMPIGEKDSTPPDVFIDYSGVSYISPNFDGIKDELNFPINVEDERYIASYEFIITDSFGKVVKSIVNKEERPENESIKNLWSKMINPKTGIVIPESFRWDGKKDNGEIASDGDYYFYTRFSDDNGNETTTEKKKFVVDNTNPYAELSPPAGLDLIFSPNGDGNKDVLTIPQSGSSEVRWYAEVTDFLGNSVKSEAWDNKPVSTFMWDGKDDSGQLVPDGVYQYRVSSTDLAGNSAEYLVDNIIINTKQPPIGINISTNSFSPNGDSVKDNMEFVLDIPVKTGIINWNLKIKDKNNNVINDFSTKKAGYSVIEDNIRFDGRDSGGQYLKEGKYSGELSVVYQNGHSPVITSPEFEIDVTAPKADVEPRYTMFSPNGDNSKDYIVFDQSSSVEEEWFGEIYDEFGTLISSTNWKGEIDKEFIWSGKTDEGQLLDDGLFTYVLTSTDKSGNSYKGEPVKFELNTTKSKIDLTLSRDAFSPKDKKEFIEITPVVDSSVDVDNYTLEIVDKNNKSIRTLSRNQDLSSSYKWDGLTESGVLAADDYYFARINSEFINGNRVSVSTTKITIDTVSPVVKVTRKDKFSVFSPNGDGLKDSISMNQTTSLEDKWVGEIYNESGDVVYSTSWSGIAPKEFVFTGKNSDNQNLPDGKYSYRLSAVDRAGNRGQSDLIPVEIDTEDVELFVSTDKAFFSPNGDKIKDSVEFIPEIKKTDGIDSIVYQVTDSNNSVVFSRSSTSDFIKSIIWDGRNQSGKTAIDGKYSVKLTVNYKRGDSPSASTQFTIDTVAPVAKVLTESEIFSPNGDGNKDFAKISNISSDKARWTLSIKDSKNLVVKESVLNGDVPKEWNFDGRGSDLSLLQNGKYIYNLQGVDEAGNIYNSGDILLNMDNSTSTVFISNDNEVFSPNGDGIKDKVIFTSKIDSLSPVDSWKFVIQNRDNITVREFNGTSLPKPIIWDGMDNKGVKVKDGFYKGTISIVNKNGNNPKSSTPEFELDTLFPVINLSAENRLFSPNGDSLKDNVILKQSGVGEDLYRGTVYNSSNQVVNQWFWKNSLSLMNWDGRDSSGNISKDGKYRYVVETTDRGGNKTGVSINDIVIDTTETDIFITYKKPVFAPDLTSSLGGQIFGLIVNNREGIESWSITISDKEGVVKVLNGGATVPETYEWNGKDSNDRYTNGILTAKFNVVYKKGNSPVYSTKEFTADSEAPMIMVKTSPTPFSPDDDYVDDELSIELGVKDLSSIEKWSFDIKDPVGNHFITFQGEGKPGKKIIWDGKSSTGELVQAAEEYEYTMSVVDAAGHTGVFNGQIPVDILVIKDGDKFKIKVSSIIFEPNSSDLVLTGENGESNKKILKRLSEILNKYSTYNIVVEGHAHNIYGDKVTKGQRNSLIDFSKKRADEVKDSLVKLGISGGRMTTVGVGGDDPVVKSDDTDNIWKNRRVEFILVK